MNKTKVFVVEDSKTYQTLYREIFDKKRFEYELLPDANNVLASVLRFKPDVIILDYYLPVGNGVSVCEEIMSHPETKNIPVIMVTSNEEISNLKKAYKAGAIDYLRKPFNEIELLIRIENVLNLVKTHKENVQMKQDIAVTEMGRSIAHHINQPLTTILGAVEIIRLYRENVDKELSELLDIVVDGTTRLAQTVQKVQNATEYKTVHYLNDIRIVDLGED